MPPVRGWDSCHLGPVASVYIWMPSLVNSCVQLTAIDGLWQDAASGVAGRRVSGSEVDRLVSSIEASFGAAIAREEDVAASDLALSLRQGRSLAEVLGRQGGRVVRGGGERAISEVGRDYVVLRGGTGAEEIIPLPRLGSVRPGSGERPVVSDEPLVGRLRRWCRGGGAITVETSDGAFEGRLSVVGVDYLELQAAGGPMIVPVEKVRSVRLARGDSTGGP